MSSRLTEKINLNFPCHVSAHIISVLTLIFGLDDMWVKRHVVSKGWIAEKLFDDIQRIAPNELYRLLCLVASKFNFGDLPLGETGQYVHPAYELILRGERWSRASVELWGVGSDFGARA